MGLGARNRLEKTKNEIRHIHPQKFFGDSEIACGVEVFLRGRFINTDVTSKLYSEALGKHPEGVAERHGIVPVGKFRESIDRSCKDASSKRGSDVSEKEQDNKLIPVVRGLVADFTNPETSKVYEKMVKGSEFTSIKILFALCQETKGDLIKLGKLTNALVESTRWQADEYNRPDKKI